MTGLDINVKFNSVSSFEFNPAISLLDVLKIKIFHLWVIDSGDPLFEHIHDLTYNQLVEKIFDDAEMKGKFTRYRYKSQNWNLEWHDRTCSQTTEVGLIQLLEEMKNGEIAVLFRNNHYLTVTKQKDKLFR